MGASDTSGGKTVAVDAQTRENTEIALAADGQTREARSFLTRSRSRLIFAKNRRRSILMKKQRICLWTGGEASIGAACQSLANTLPEFPDPLPLYRTAYIEYRWGATKFEIVATACSPRITSWGDEQMTWLHCKAMQTAAIKPDETTSLMNVLIPAHYITTIKPGPTFRLHRSRHCEDIGVFPPIQPTPADAVPLEEIERVIAELLAPERN
jgi:hypothetical protein